MYARSSLHVEVYLESLELVSKIGTYLDNIASADIKEPFQDPGRVVGKKYQFNSIFKRTTCKNLSKIKQSDCRY